MIVEKIKLKVTKRARKIVGSVRSLLGLSYASRLTEADVFGLLDAKSIALVGNAASLAGTVFGAAIDAHDVVIRFNAVPLPSVTSHGVRTTIIATSIVIEPDLVKSRGAAHVFFMSPKPKYLPDWMTMRPDFFLFSVASHAVLMNEVGARPSTGMMVIDILRRSNCARVDLYGFDFFGSVSLSDNRQRKSTPHDFGAERDIVAGLLRGDGRFHLNNSTASIN